MTQTWLHKADPTYSGARPKNGETTLLRKYRTRAVGLSVKTLYLLEWVHARVEVRGFEHAQSDVQPQLVHVLHLLRPHVQTQQLHSGQHVAHTAQLLLSAKQEKAHSVNCNQDGLFLSVYWRGVKLLLSDFLGRKMCFGKDLSPLLGCVQFPTNASSALKVLLYNSAFACNSDWCLTYLVLEVVVAQFLHVLDGRFHARRE